LLQQKLLAPSEAFRLLHVLEHFLVLAVLRVHAHACNGDGSNASRDAEAPIDSGIHGCVMRRREARLRVLWGGLKHHAFGGNGRRRRGLWFILCVGAFCRLDGYQKDERGRWVGKGGMERGDWSEEGVPGGRYLRQFGESGERAVLAFVWQKAGGGLHSTERFSPQHHTTPTPTHERGRGLGPEREP
jgi:hypothetical protein